MSETTKPNPFTAITAMEAAAFRVGQLARQLIAEHGDAITLDSVFVFGYEDGHGNPELKLRARDVDSALAVADALGIELKTGATYAGYPGPYQPIHGETSIDGVKVGLRTTRLLEADEAAAWRAEQDQAAAENPAAGGGAE